MALADQITAHGQESLQKLTKIRAYYEHTQTVWRLAQRIVDEGGQVSIRNIETNRFLQPQEIHGLAQTYVTGHLAESVFEKTVSLFEDFFFGLLGAWLTAQPLGIPSKERQIAFSVVFDATDKQAIVQYIIESELDGLKYKSVPKWFEYLKGRVDLGTPINAQISALTEIKATRDILVHSAGIVNDIYIRKTGAAARYKIGDQVEIREPYLFDSWALVDTVFREMTASAIIKAGSMGASSS